jgi:hypothetical protein
MMETGFGHALGWTTFVTHPSVEPKLRGCRFGSPTADGPLLLAPDRR